MNPLTCPKCQGQMRQYERNSVTVDQCGECRGIFLDRGELEHLVDAEAKWSADARPPVQPVQQPPAQRYEQPRYERPRHHDDYKHHYKKKRRGSFFEELFDD